MTADPAFTGERPLLPILQDLLEKGEQVRWAGRPDFLSVIRTKLFLWWLGVPWSLAVAAAYFFDWISGGVALPLGLAGFAFLAAPFILLFEGEHTVFAITDRRALIVHHGMKHEVMSRRFEDMDDKLEIIETGRGAGHVYFASNLSTRLRDVDHIGKLAFRDVGNAKEVARILDQARGKRSA
jgi:hypothetical protein